MEIINGMKECCKCGEIKHISCFCKDRQRKDGLCPQCRDCRSAYYLDNKEHISKHGREYREKNKEYIRKKKREYSENSPHIRMKWLENNSGYSKKWYYDNHEHVLEYQRAYKTERYNDDIQYRLLALLRGRFSRSLGRGSEAGSAVRDLGCGINELKEYLESLFLEGMTWENHGIHGWHIDHIIPLSSFDLTDRGQILIACNYKNLQPLWAKDNLSKGDKIEIRKETCRV